MSIVISIVVLSVFGVLFAAMAVAPLVIEETQRHPAADTNHAPAPISMVSGHREHAAAAATTFEQTAA